MLTRLLRLRHRRPPPPFGGSWYDTAEISRSAGEAVNMDALGHTVAPSGIGLWVVADGLGGHPRSEVASNLAVQTILAHFRATPAFGREAITALFAAANTAVLNARASDPALAEIATTLVVLLSNGTHAIWGHVGDSRLYFCGDGEISLATIDHRNAGRELVRAMPAPDLVPELRSGPLHRNDALLLCVDGVWEALLDLEIAVDYAKSKSAADWLSYLDWRVRGRRAENGDSVSAVAVRMLHPGLQEADAAAPLPQLPGSTGTSRSGRRRAIKLSALGLAAGLLLIAIVLGINEVKRSFEIRALIASVEEQAILADRMAEEARRAAERAISDAAEALDAQRRGRADEVSGRASSAEAYTMAAYKAAIEARRVADLAASERKKLTGVSGGSEQSHVNANTANDRANAAESSAHDASAAMATARNAALVAAWVDEVKQRANAARTAAMDAKSAATDIKKAADTKAQNSARSQEADANVIRVGRRADDAEGAARIAKIAAADTDAVHLRLTALQSRLSFLKPNGIEDAKEAASRARDDAQEAEASAASAWADALEAFGNSINMAVEQVQLAESKVAKAQSAIQGAKSTLTAALTLQLKIPRQQANDRVNAVWVNATEAGRAAANALEKIEAALRRLDNVPQSKSNSAAVEALLRKAKEAEGKAHLAVDQAQALAEQAKDLAKQAEAAALPIMPARPPTRPAGSPDPTSGAVTSGGNEPPRQSEPTGKGNGAAGDLPPPGSLVTPDTAGDANLANGNNAARN